MYQVPHFVLPHEDNEDEKAERYVGQVDQHPVPVGAAGREADQLHSPVHAHHDKQFQVQAVSMRT